MFQVDRPLLTLAVIAVALCAAAATRQKRRVLVGVPSGPANHGNVSSALGRAAYADVLVRAARVDGESLREQARLVVRLAPAESPGAVLAVGRRQYLRQDLLRVRGGDGSRVVERRANTRTESRRPRRRVDAEVNQGRAGRMGSRAGVRIRHISTRLRTCLVVVGRRPGPPADAPGRTRPLDDRTSRRLPAGARARGSRRAASAAQPGTLNPRASGDCHNRPRRDIGCRDLTVNVVPKIGPKHLIRGSPQKRPDSSCVGQLRPTSGRSINDSCRKRFRLFRAVGSIQDRYLPQRFRPIWTSLA